MCPLRDNRAIDADSAAVIELEQRLLSAEIRADTGEVLALLHEDFSEFGASGRSYDRASVIEALEASNHAPIQASCFSARRLGPNAILLSYHTDSPSLRTSVWIREDGGPWRVIHHHGTSTFDG